MMMKWSFAKVWNDSIEQREERPMKPRTHIWAGELGGSYIDRYLKMHATPPSNPLTPRSLRKFEAGNIWEWIIKVVLLRAGVLQTHNEWVDFSYPDLMRVTGKLDFRAGGKPDWDKAKKHVEGLLLPEFIIKATDNIIEVFRKTYPDGLETLILEVKSCSGFMFDLYEKSARPGANHKLQLFHYLKAKHIGEGHIVYVSKDDCRMLEIPIFNPSNIEDEYKKDIEIMTGYFKNNERPPEEKPIVYDADFRRFSANWKVAYSSYLFHIYAIRSQMEFDDKYKSTVERWNRVLERLKDGKKITDKNKKAMEEIEKDFPGLLDKHFPQKEKKGVEDGGESNDRRTEEA